MEPVIIKKGEELFAIFENVIVNKGSDYANVKSCLPTNFIANGVNYREFSPYYGSVIGFPPIITFSVEKNINCFGITANVTMRVTYDLLDGKKWNQPN